MGSGMKSYEYVTSNTTLDEASALLTDEAHASIKMASV